MQTVQRVRKTLTVRFVLHTRTGLFFNPDMTAALPVTLTSQYDVGQSSAAV